MVRVDRSSLFGEQLKSAIKKGCNRLLLLHPFFLSGGDVGDRTPDLMTASHALSQLSYTPSCFI